MNLKIKYYDRVSGVMVETELPTDVLEVVIPEDELPELSVQVNTDAVMIDRKHDHQRIASFDYSDLYAEALPEMQE